MKAVVASRPDGLGTRLLTLLSGLRFAENLEASFEIEWPSLCDSSYPLNGQLLQSKDIADIFVAHQPIIGRNDVRFVTLSQDKAVRRLNVHQEFGNINGRGFNRIAKMIDGYDYALYNTPEPVVFRGQSAASEIEATKSNWLRINFAPDVVHSVNNFSHSFPLSDIVGVHVRRGDVVNILKYQTLEFLIARGGTQIFQRYIPYQTIARILGSQFKHSNYILVCTDSPEAADELQKFLPNHKVIQSTIAEAKNPNQRAIIDLILLSRSSCLISPFKSYFSTCAATVGRCKMINAGLDIPSLVDELTALLETSDATHVSSRKSLIYTLGYLNLWNHPDSPMRNEMLRLAMDYDSEICRLLLDRSARK